MKKLSVLLLLIILSALLFTGCSSSSSSRSSSYNSSNPIRDTLGGSYYDGLKDAFDNLP